MHWHHHDSIDIPLGPVSLRGDLAIPSGAPGLVIFSHGSGSSRHSPRNRAVAERLQRSQWATLLMDLLSEEEDRVYATRFDIDLLTERLLGVTRWARQHLLTAALPIGYFGASTGAASALRAAAELGREIRAVVSRGGRPDLAEAALGRVVSPTLLIVGSHDHPVLSLNRQAYDRLSAVKRLDVIPGATHLFEEPGALEKVADLAAEWFALHMPRPEELHAFATALPPQQSPKEETREVWWS
jgi:pimeloyl-ACP methyl ester carboxylesterase